MKLVLTLFFFISACEYTPVDRILIQNGISTDICHDGIVYVNFSTGVSVKYSRDGTIQRCK